MRAGLFLNSTSLAATRRCRSSASQDLHAPQNMVIPILVGLSCLVVWRWRDIEVQYHFREMRRAYDARLGESSQSGSLMSRPFDESANATYETHRDALIAMGEIVEIAYTFEHLQYPSPECRHFFVDLYDGNSHPEFIDWTSDQNSGVTIPMNFTVWCLRKDERQWRQYIADRDIPDYSRQFGVSYPGGE